MGLTLRIFEVDDVAGVIRSVATDLLDVWTSGGLCVGAREWGGRGRKTDLEALGLKTLHIGQVLVACWREPTA